MKTTVVCRLYFFIVYLFMFIIKCKKLTIATIKEIETFLSDQFICGMNEVTQMEQQKKM